MGQAGVPGGSNFQAQNGVGLGSSAPLPLPYANTTLTGPGGSGPLWMQTGAQTMSGTVSVVPGLQTLVAGPPVLGDIGVQAQFPGPPYGGVSMGSNSSRGVALSEVSEVKPVEKIQMITHHEHTDFLSQQYKTGEKDVFIEAIKHGRGEDGAENLSKQART